MRNDKLMQALSAVPLVATMGITVESVQLGEVVLRLPAIAEIQGHGGMLHTGALFTVGELAAGVLLGTHPRLATARHLIRGSCVRYHRAAPSEVLAHATLGEAEIAGLLAALSEGGRAEVEIPVRVVDAEGREVAELTVRYALRAP